SAGMVTPITDDPRGAPADDRPGGDVPGDHGPHADHRPFSDADAVGDPGAGTDPHVAAHADTAAADRLIADGAGGVELVIEGVEDGAGGDARPLAEDDPRGPAIEARAGVDAHVGADLDGAVKEGLGGDARSGA